MPTPANALPPDGDPDQEPDPDPDQVRRAKAALRASLGAARRARAVAERAADSERIRVAALAAPQIAAAGTVAAYVSTGTEPDTRALLEDLRARGIRVLLPVLLADRDLDWGEYDGPAGLSAGQAGGGHLLEPSGQRLGVAEIETADAILAPGLAVSVQGLRLGRGGGSYDRALKRAAPACWIAVVLFDDEVLPSVPAESHDRPVAAALTPSGVRRLGP